MKTLVIHIDDRTTDFLSKIYIDKGWKRINYKSSRKKLVNMIYNHDRIVMCGHGSPSGLFGKYGYIIDDSFAELLRTKETVCIWCNAKQFVERNSLKGFYTGMFISEVQEAIMMGINTSTTNSIIRSNDMFAESMRKHIFSENVLEKVKHEYHITNDDVINYNRNRLYYR